MDNIIQYNINGFSTNRADLEAMIHVHQPIAFALQETHHLSSSPLSLSGYECRFNYRDTSSQGVGICIRKDFGYVPIPIQSPLQVVAVKILSSPPISVCSIYIHHSITLQQSHLKNIITQLPTPFFILGDFNAHNSLWGDSRTDLRGRIIEDVLLSENLLLLNDGSPTYIHRGSLSPSSIDLSLAHPALGARLSWSTITPFRDDHMPILISLHRSSSSFRSSSNKFIEEKADWPNFSSTIFNSINRISWADNIDSNISSFIDIILDSANSHIPRSVPRKHRPVPWWSKEIDILYKRFKSSYNKFKSNPSPFRYSNYKSRRNSFKNAAKEAKTLAWNTFCSSFNSSTPSHILWKNFRRINNSNSSHFPNSILHNNIPISQTPDIANLFSSHFSAPVNVPNQSAQNALKNCILNFPLSSSSPPPLLNSFISLHELLKILKSCNGKTPGFDLISYVMLKNIPQNALLFLLRIYNHILSKGVFPDSWKNAIIIPIHKAGKNPQLLSSYRPISLLSCISKVFEKILSSRLSAWILDHNFLTSSQFAFRKGLSSEDALVSLSDFIISSLNNKMHVDSISLDLISAYDNTWKETIILQLLKWGIHGPFLQTISSFLSDRRHFVSIRGYLSTVAESHVSLPQGSPLSVTLFLCAINSIVDIPPQDHLINFTLYADDVLISWAHPKSITVPSPLQHTLSNIESWADRFGFKFSETKSSHTHFCRFHSCPQQSFMLGGRSISREESLKFLGVFFDRNMSWKKHIFHLKAKAVKLLGLLRMISGTRWGGDRNSLLKIADGTIRSSLEYGSLVYGGASCLRLRSLDVIYNSAIRIALGAFPTSPITSLYTEANRYSLECRRSIKLIKYWGKITSIPWHPNNKPVPINFPDSRLKPFHQRVALFLNEWGIATPSLFSFARPLLRPLSSLVVDISLSHFKKETTPPSVYRSLFSDAINIKYPSFIPIFTDGSKSSSSCGFAIFSPSLNISMSFCAPIFSSVFSMEALAVFYALVKTPIPNNVLILTDSLSVATAVNSLPSSNPIVSGIQSMMASRRVVLMWVPSHVGIEGNEMVDRLAKNPVSPVPFQHCSYFDFVNYCKSRWYLREQRLWDSSNDKLRAIQSSRINSIPFPSLPRNLSVKLTRLRLGHCKFSHSYLMDKSLPPICPFCYLPLSVDHILSACTSVFVLSQKIRFGLFGLPAALLLRLDRDHGPLIGFLSALDLLDVI